MREARGYVATIIGKQPPGSPLKTHFPRVARLFGLSERRVRAFWHGEAAPSGQELDAMRLAVARNVGRQACDELIFYAARLEAAAIALEMMDADFHRTEIARLRDMARRIRRGGSGPADARVSAL